VSSVERRVERAEKNMNRKITVLTLCAMILAFSYSASAQQPAKAARIGYLDGGTAAGSAELLDDFRKRMTQFDWIEGKNLTIEYRYAEGKRANRLADLAVELVGLKLDAIIVTGTSGALAAKKATSTIPIVMVNVGDPVAQGLIVSLARPGGNITGLATFADELPGKRVEILKEVLPKSTRIGVITAGVGICSRAKTGRDRVSERFREISEGISNSRSRTSQCDHYS
jgi:putative tryptophan/tyrosine transport system substrate-binding protein